MLALYSRCGSIFLLMVSIQMNLQWRINLAFIILAVSTSLLFIPNLKKKHYVGIFLFAVYPIIAFFLLSGNETLGMKHVGTHKWGGLFLTFLSRIYWDSLCFATRYCSCSWKKI